MAKKIDQVADDTKAQITQLRRQVETLMNETVTPTIVGAAGQVEDTARQGIDFTRDKANAASGRIREQPLVAVAVALGAGYLIGRLVHT